MSHRQLIAALCCSFGLFSATSLWADDLTATQLLPETTVGYLEVTDTAAILSNIYDHPLSHHIQGLDVFKKATETEGYRGFLTGRKFVEIQIGANWRPALEALTAGGVYVAFDAKTQGAVALVRAKDEETAENFRAKILELSRLNEAKNGKADPYRDVTVYKLDKKSAAAVVRDWIVMTNKGELGKSVLDRLLDDQPAGRQAEVAGTLSANPQFKLCHALRKKDSQAWAYGNIEAIRDAGAAKKLFEGKAENPAAELLIGGIQSVLQHAPFVTADLNLSDSGLTLQLATPWQGDWIPEERTYFFGADHKGSAPTLPEVPDTLMTLGTYRDVSEMWLRAGDLFNEQMNDQLAQAESGLSTIFAGKDFGEEILGSLDPQMGLLVTRQRFENRTPIPALKLPAFALVLKLRDPETMRPELRRTFQSVIGFFNIVGAMDGRPQLEMDMTKEGNVDLITSHYVPEKKDQDSTSAAVIFNFSPSAAFFGDQFILSSTAELAKQLATAPAVRESDTGVNTQLNLHADSIRETLIDNREQLISQNMLAEGHSREEAATAIDLLFEFVRCLKGAGITLRQEEDSLALQLHVDVNENP
ncbi:MAG TPA: hypothetical protein PK992_16285 [Planctomycetaceae bacterium]|nr:hypothetical protein [Planctomycetaceae bacterium]